MMVTPVSPLRYLLIHDVDGWWYVIPEDKERDFLEWMFDVEAYWKNIPEDDIHSMGAEKNQPPAPEWAVWIGDEPTNVTFADFQVKE